MSVHVMIDKPRPTEAPKRPLLNFWDDAEIEEKFGDILDEFFTKQERDYYKSYIKTEYLAETKKDDVAGIEKKRQDIIKEFRSFDDTSNLMDDDSVPSAVSDSDSDSDSDSVKSNKPNKKSRRDGEGGGNEPSPMVTDETQIALNNINDVANEENIIANNLNVAAKTFKRYLGDGGTNLNNANILVKTTDEIVNSTEQIVKKSNKVVDALPVKIEPGLNIPEKPVTPTTYTTEDVDKIKELVHSEAYKKMIKELKEKENEHIKINKYLENFEKTVKQDQRIKDLQTKYENKLDTLKAAIKEELKKKQSEIPDEIAQSGDNIRKTLNNADFTYTNDITDVSLSITDLIEKLKDIDKNVYTYSTYKFDFQASKDEDDRIARVQQQIDDEKARTQNQRDQLASKNIDLNKAKESLKLYVNDEEVAPVFEAKIKKLNTDIQNLADDLILSDQTIKDLSDQKQRKKNIKKFTESEALTEEEFDAEQKDKKAAAGEGGKPATLKKTHAVTVTTPVGTTDEANRILFQEIINDFEKLPPKERALSDGKVTESSVLRGKFKSELEKRKIAGTTYEPKYIKKILTEIEKYKPSEEKKKDKKNNTPEDETVANEETSDVPNQVNTGDDYSISDEVNIPEQITKFGISEKDLEDIMKNVTRDMKKVAKTTVKNAGSEFRKNLKTEVDSFKINNNISNNIDLLPADIYPILIKISKFAEPEKLKEAKTTTPIEPSNDSSSTIDVDNAAQDFINQDNKGEKSKWDAVRKRVNFFLENKYKTTDKKNRSSVQDIVQKKYGLQPVPKTTEASFDNERQFFIRAARARLLERLESM